MYWLTRTVAEYPVVAGKRFSSSFGDFSFKRDRLMRLEQLANKRPGDANIQENYMRELVKQGYIDAAVARHESGRFNTRASSLGHYARGQQNSFSHVPPNPTMNPMNTQQLASGQSFSQQDMEPLVVQIAEPSTRAQLWKLSRSLLSAAIGLAAFGLFIDAQTGGGLSGGGGAGGMPPGGGAAGGPRGILGVRNYEIQPDADKKSFKDVKGADEVKHELEEIVAYLRDPGRFTRLGGKLSKGVLLTGSPGVGKTLLAKAVAGEAGVPFFYASGSEFEELYVGVGARRVRDLFAAARKRAPCIIFIDEIDAVGSTRQLKEQQSLKMTLNQLLVELDGFGGSQGIIVLAATNFPKSLDPALVRPGRFDRVVQVPLPDIKGRSEIISHYLEKITKASDVKVDQLARATSGMSGADLANMVNIAAVSAASENANSVSHVHLERAFDRILMGLENAKRVIPEEVRQCTAFHEGGHALVAMRTDGALPVHKATIVPRGPSLGRVQQLPEEKDMVQESKKQMVATLDVLMAGRVAEEMVFGADNVTSGASSDLEKATRLAYAMVAHYGLLPNSPVGLGVDLERASPETKRLVDVEVRNLLDSSYQRVKGLLSKHRKDLDTIAHALLEKETLTGSELKSLIKL